MSESECDPSRRASEPVQVGSVRRRVREGFVCVPANHDGPYKGTNVQTFRFRGTLYRVRDWTSMLGKLCSLVRSDNPETFERVLRIGGARRALFSRDASLFQRPWRVGDGLWVETNLSANNCKALCDEIVRYFGYGRELEVELW